MNISLARESERERDGEIERERHREIKVDPIRGSNAAVIKPRDVFSFFNTRLIVDPIRINAYSDLHNPFLRVSLSCVSHRALSYRATESPTYLLSIVPDVTLP